VSDLGVGALPDGVFEPEDEPRGTVIVLGGIGETVADFRMLTDQLVLAGFRVELFDDVSFDPVSSRYGALQSIQDAATERPHVLIGSDVGATLAADIAASRPHGLTAVVLANLVTAASRPAVDPADPNRSRLPQGVNLPQARAVLLPTLVFHGDTDEVTDVADAVSWATQLRFGAVRLVQRGDHGVLRGESRRTVAASIVLFLERQRAGEPVLTDGFA
jgi:alpha-beta hydrolase superfamily lysophospholipase